MNRPLQWLARLEPRFRSVLLLALVVAMLPIFIENSFHLRVAVIIYIFGLATLGLNVLMGFTGLVSLGHAGFLAIGAYAVAIGPARLGMPPWLALVVGVAVSGLLAAAVGRPILKLKGHYFAVASLGLGLLVAMVVTNEVQLTGGPDGMAVQRLVLFGWAARGATAWYWISGVVLVAAAWGVANLIGSPSGRALRAIHDSEVAADVLGVDVPRYKLLAFVLAACMAALAGGMLAQFDGHITPVSASFLRSVEFVTMAVIGGLGSIVGSVVGAALMVLLPQVLVSFHDYEHIFLGLLMMLFMIFLRSGVVPSLTNRFGIREL